MCYNFGTAQDKFRPSKFTKKMDLTLQRQMMAVNTEEASTLQSMEAIAVQLIVTINPKSF